MKNNTCRDVCLSLRRCILLGNAFSSGLFGKFNRVDIENVCGKVSVDMMLKLDNKN